ncbi:MAG: DUF4388 domain-containing protein [Deltaproteobacteria bacterium]|nr:DUF4388 domain-containing protein [Deltaproteobacteria bacterium]
MDFSDIRVVVVSVDNCPFHADGDIFSFSGRAVRLGNENFLCLSLCADLANIYPGISDAGTYPVELDCTGARSGCPGRIRYRVEALGESQGGYRSKVDEKSIAAVSSLLLGLPMFESFDRKSMRGFLYRLRLASMQDLGFKPLKKNEIIIEKGRPGTDLYIIIAGNVAVIDGDGNILATLSKGDVFGEMSLISGNPVGATVKAVSATSVLRLSSGELNSVLPRYPALQSYFTRLLAGRLARTTIDRAKDLSSAMGGRLSDMPPEELLQALNLNRKTGVLNFKLPLGQGEIYFRNGDIVFASYDGNAGHEAVISIVKTREGSFSFEPELPAGAEGRPALGNFMGMLMNALKELDEQQAP